MVLPLLFGLLGGSLGSAGMLGGLGALGGAAIGSGLGGYAQTGDLETGILTGLGAFAGGALLGPMMGGAGGAGGAAANAASASNAATTAAAAANPATAPMGGLGSLLSGPAPASTASILGTTGGAANSGIIGNVMNFAKTGVGMGAGVGGMVGGSLAPMLFGGKGGDGGGGASGDKEMKPMPRQVRMPPRGYRAGIDPEFNYGLGSVPSANQILSYRDRMYDGGMVRRLQQQFGLAKMAEGGLATLVEGGDEGSVPSAAGGGNEKDVVVEAIRAIKGQSPNPEVALGAFLAQYGEDALRDLVDQVEEGAVDETASMSEGKVRGAGDGMDDLIPARVEGSHDVLLSDGEFVVPADVVSGLGNGSSDAGARALEQMMERVRMARNGSADQPAQVPQEEVLPA